MHKISIIIPCFNRSHSLVRAIESVKNQTFKEWELIIVDDGSKDNTSSIVEPYLLDSRIKYYCQNNKGVSSARNLGAHKATGEYFIFFDSDDFIYPDLIEKLYLANFTNYDLIFWQVWKEFPNSKKLWKAEKLDKLYNGITATFLAGSVCYHKDLFYQAGAFDPRIKFGENYELGIRVSEIPNLKIKYLNQPLLKYNINPAKRISDSTENRIESYLYLYKKHKIKFDKYPIVKSQMFYLTGYVFEKSSNYLEASNYYKRSWQLYPFKIKALYRILKLQIKKLMT